MNPDPASLDNLRDIALPPAVSWFPLAPGWWFVLALMLIAVLVFSFRFWQTWRGNAYRRAALLELTAASDISDIAAILKRTALACYPRSEVAPLTGEAWFEWLGKTGGEAVPNDVCDALTDGVFGRDSAASQQKVAEFASAWVANHLPGNPQVDDQVTSSENPGEANIAC